MTRHVTGDERTMAQQRKIRISPKSGKTRKRVKYNTSKLSLSDRVANLRLLLTSKSFSRWPLHVHFFSADVHRVWEALHKADVETGETLPEVKTILDDVARPEDASRLEDGLHTRGIHALDVTYHSQKSHLEKSQQIISCQSLRCSDCAQAVDTSRELVLVCPTVGCRTVSHLSCRSKATSLADRSGYILPVTSRCSGCAVEHAWADLVKDLSLRMRGQKEIAALYKVRQRQKRGVDAVEDQDETDEIGSEDDTSMLDDEAALDDAGFRMVDEVVPEDAATDDPQGFTAPMSARDGDWDEVEILD